MFQVVESAWRQLSPLSQIGKRVESQRVIIDTPPSTRFSQDLFLILTPVPISRDRSRARLHVLLSTFALRVFYATEGYLGGYSYLDLFHQGVIPREALPIYLKDSLVGQLDPENP